MNFKLAYTRATQNESFAAMGLADGTQPRADFGGQIDSTLAQVGLTMHPMPRLSVLLRASGGRSDAAQRNS